MANSRSFLIAAALLVFCAASALAQATPCLISSTAIPIRHEGVTELLPQVTVTCTVPTGGSVPAGLYDISVFSDAPITSVPGTAANGYKDGEIRLRANGNTYGAAISGNTATFTGVDIGGLSIYSFTLSGVRVNASTLPAASVVLSGIGFTFFATPENKAAPPFFVGSPFYRVANVAYPINTLGFAVTYPTGSEPALSQCEVRKNSTDDVFDLNFSASYAGAFLTRQDESAYEYNAPDTNPYGFVSNGTRLSATFSNIPTNTQLSVPATWKASDGKLAVAVVKSDGTLYAVTNPVTYINVTPGTPIVCEITGDTTTGTPTIKIPVAVSYTGIPGLAAANSASVTGNYAPQPTNPGAAASPIPRFTSAVQSGSGLFAVTACSTSMLFPYVTTQPGWDVGLAVSNTGADPFGDAGQPGTCAFSFYGTDGQGKSTAPASAVALGAAGFGDTTTIAPGTTAADVASNAIGAGATFQGYAVAVCNFQFAHGYAFVIGNVSGAEVAHGYLALVLQGQTINELNRSGQNGQYEKVGF